MREPHTALTLIETFEAGTAGPTDLATLAGVFGELRRNGGMWDEAFGLPPGGLEAERRRDRDEAIAAALRAAESARISGKDLRRRLTRYEATAFIRDRVAGKAGHRDNAELYRIMMANGGKVPSLTLLREQYNK